MLSKPANWLTPRETPFKIIQSSFFERHFSTPSPSPHKKIHPQRKISRTGESLRQKSVRVVFTCEISD